MAIAADQDRQYLAGLAGTAVGLEQNIRALKGRVDRLQESGAQIAAARKMLVEKRATVAAHEVHIYDAHIAKMDEAAELNHTLFLEAGREWWQRRADRDQLKELMATGLSKPKARCRTRTLIRRTHRNARAKVVVRTVRVTRTATKKTAASSTGDPDPEPDSSARPRSSAEVAS